jgi:accessory gene regulator B
MISKISNKIVKYLIEQKDLSTNEQELYSYGLFILLSQILYFIITVFIGIILGVILESIIFYIAFQFIRRYAGGYHASTETRCEIMSTLSIVACIVVIKLSKIYDFQTVLFIITMVSAVLIFFLCPLDTPEKPLTEKEFKYFRKISWLILIAITIAVIISYCFKFRFVLVPCCMSLILESILLVAGKVKRVSQENSAK